VSLLTAALEVRFADPADVVDLTATNRHPIVVTATGSKRLGRIGGRNSTTNATPSGNSPPFPGPSGGHDAPNTPPRPSPSRWRRPPRPSRGQAESPGLVRSPSARPPVQPRFWGALRNPGALCRGPCGVLGVLQWRQDYPNNRPPTRGEDAFLHPVRSAPALLRHFLG
jgi:hypothetical protein